MKKFISAVLVLAIIMCCSTGAFALPLEGGIESLIAQFEQGEGPVKGDYSIDYSYFSPVSGDDDSTKYPLVIWLHGMGDGSGKGKPVEKSNIAYWASDEFQSRFKPSGGAYILAARSREEDNIFWSNELLEPLKAAIDDFIVKNKDSIDLTRIYVGGYSMGGKMTLKMAVAYPEMFAAAFPICPAWSPSEKYAAYLADVPVWLTSSTRDPLVNYYFSVTPTWEKIIAASNTPELCRFSTLTKVCYQDGTKTASSHHAWFAVNYDMFSSENGAYPNMTTVNGLGEELTLSYPDGMISWLSEQTSDYNGELSEGMGNINPDDNTDNMMGVSGIWEFFEVLFNAIFSVLGIK